MGRQGIPDGWAGRREELDAIRAAAHVEAKGIVQHMTTAGIIGGPEDPRAEEALEAVIAIVRAKDKTTGQHVHPARDRVTAAGAVLNFTKQRPGAQADVSVRLAEDFLEEVAAAAGRDD